MSTTYIAVFVGALGYVLRLAQVPFIDADLQTFASVAMTLGGALWVLYKRYKQGGVNVIGRRV